MKAYEMENKAKASLSEKLGAYYGTKEPKPVEDRFSSYEEAKKAAEAAAKEGHDNYYAQRSMIAHKMNTFRGAVKRAQLDKLAGEYEAMSITDIQSKLKAVTQDKEELNRYLDKIFDAEAKKAESQYKKMGLIGAPLESAVAEHMGAWVKGNSSYLEAQIKYSEVDMKYIALNSAIDAFKVRNKDLIEAAAEEKRKAEVQAYLASLEESSEEG